MISNEFLDTCVYDLTFQSTSESNKRDEDSLIKVIKAAEKEYNRFLKSNKKYIKRSKMKEKKLKLNCLNLATANLSKFYLFIICFCYIFCNKIF